MSSSEQAPLAAADVAPVAAGVVGDGDVVALPSGSVVDVGVVVGDGVDTGSLEPPQARVTRRTTTTNTTSSTTRRRQYTALGNGPIGSTTELTRAP
jgi:hypothetical protein